jgi:hypothetical protein
VFLLPDKQKEDFKMILDKKSFQISGLTFYGLGFQTLSKGRDCLESLYAVFYYAHHGGSVEDINETLIAKGLRPMTQMELFDFFAIHQLSLSNLDHPFFVTTAPEDIFPDKDNEHKLLLPGIWKEGTALKHGNVCVEKFAEGKAYLSDHTWYVIAIDESKSKRK